MLREIIKIWKGHSFMKQVVECVGKMLDNDKYLFDHAWEAFTGKVVLAEIRDTFRKRDDAVNELERRVRKMVIEHLAINPAEDAPGCLAMMSLVKDVERVGDYSKNIFELATLLDGQTQNLSHLEELGDIQREIAENLDKLTPAFVDSDEEKAKEIIGDYTDLKARCDKIIRQLFAETLDSREALATALAARYLKRVNSHISNVATSVVYPLDKMDFVRAKDGLFE